MSSNTATTTPACAGLSICPPLPPDAEGNPACYFADGRAASVSGSVIDVYDFHELRNLSKPDIVTAEIRMKDGAVASQLPPIDEGQQLHAPPSPRRPCLDPVADRLVSPGGCTY